MERKRSYKCPEATEKILISAFFFAGLAGLASPLMLEALVKPLQYRLQISWYNLKCLVALHAKTDCSLTSS